MLALGQQWFWTPYWFSLKVLKTYWYSLQLLSAIQSIDEVLNPSSNEVKTSRGSEKSHSGKSRKWASAAPWRRELKVTQGLERPTKTEGILLTVFLIAVSLGVRVDEHSLVQGVGVDTSSNDSELNQWGQKTTLERLFKCSSDVITWKYWQKEKMNFRLMFWLAGISKVLFWTVIYGQKLNTLASQLCCDTQGI